jgi:EpsD family peptidyl-prolyl cis-trans isomerase
MRSQWVGVVSLFLALLVSACSGDKAPTGQVVAIVDGEEVTVLELRSELAGQGFRNAKDQQAAEQAALRRIINRRILAQEAREQKLGDAPEFALQRQRTEDGMLAEALQRRIAARVDKPSPHEARNYINSHPTMFGERRIFVVEQIAMQLPAERSLLKQFEPLKTLEEVEGRLNELGIHYARSMGTIDSMKLDPKVVTSMLALPPGEPFLIPGPDGVLVNRILDSRLMPASGEQALAAATAALHAERVAAAVERESRAIIARSEGAIRYNDRFRPVKAAAIAAKPAG